MRVKGRTYQRQLIKVFTVVAAVLSVALIAAGLLVERSSRISVEHAKESLEEVSIHAASSTMANVLMTVDYLSTSDNVLEWIASNPGSSEYYFSALKVFQELKRRSPTADSYSYGISITTDGPDAFVITQDGTISKSDFIFSYGITSEGFSSFAPGVYVSGDGNAFLVIINRYIGRNILTLIADLPLTLITLPLDSGIDTAVVDRSRSVVITSSDGLFAELSTVNLDEIPEGTSKIGHYSLRVEDFPSFRFSLVYAHSSDLLLPILLSVLFISVILLGAVSLAYRTQRSLYEPVRTAFESLYDEDTAEKDEFEAIIAKCREADKLFNTIEDMAQELQSASEAQKYRSYIRGMDSPSRLPDDETAYFSLAILASDKDLDERQTALLLHISSLSKKVAHLHFLLMDDGVAVLVYKDKEEEESFSRLFRLVKDYTSIDESAMLQAAITHPAEGWRSIKGLYGKAKEIIGCRYICREKTILTELDIKGAHLMHYPIASERKLINAALSASPETLNIFDEIIAENTDQERMLPESEYRQLASALVSTVQRVFQEVKEDSSIAWQEMRDSRDPGKTIESLRSILSAYIDRKTKEDEARYSRVVAAMKDYIKQHYSEPIMLIDLSEEFNLSPKYCSEIFNRVSGDTFKNYLNRFRINEAQRILDSNPAVKINDLAKMVGFASSNTFIRVFDKYMGVTPKSYAERITGRNGN